MAGVGNAVTILAYSGCILWQHEELLPTSSVRGLAMDHLPTGHQALQLHWYLLNPVVLLFLLALLL